METRYCKDCRYFGEKCQHPKNRIRKTLTGEEDFLFTPTVFRNYELADTRSCGLDGWWWEDGRHPIEGSSLDGQFVDEPPKKTTRPLHLSAQIEPDATQGAKE